ncbi:hypothetical protein M9H77_15450 [Catharanthus roseus]|uniref:Uncharacterized protein n=1 Tax=Catharanthus roseus TaxID=4058 RepID=A0ACC0B039_CATRO|nr:hypothetical protein M9H77_15450 [Catharanthus roseus]
MMGFSFSELGSIIGTIIFLCSFLQKFVPEEVWEFFDTVYSKFIGWFFPYMEITFHEYTGGYFESRSKAYVAIDTYLENHSSERANHLKATPIYGRRSLALSLDDYEGVTDYFNGIEVRWKLIKKHPSTTTIACRGGETERRFYRLTFHHRHREIVTKSYIQHVLDEGKAIQNRNRLPKLYTNCALDDDDYCDDGLWTHVLFEHPATFDTLAMEPRKKEEIMNDLISFTQSKDYYSKIGKQWKRGYLLYGPPGTGKSTLIAAMANFLQYDIYDLELTAVKDNTQLRSLLINTDKRSIIVIEDIDCSLDITGKRGNNKKDDDKKDGIVEKITKKKPKKKGKESKVTLSGLLNVLDGLWSSCATERLVIVTTNHIEKLDPALIRRGRMDKHIELSYCCFEAFKVMVKNYLDLESHELFPRIKELFEETEMSPADVAENLICKSCNDIDKQVCLENLIKALETAKEQQALKGHEEEIEDEESSSDEEDSSSSESEGE